VFSDPSHALIVTIHTIYALTCLGEDELVNSVLANLTFEAMCVIRVISGHDSFVENWKLTYAAGIRAVGTYW
jgi:hypothetical protein